MLFTTLTALLYGIAILPATVLGRVKNITVADTVQAGQNLTAVLEITSYSQNWDDFGVGLLCSSLPSYPSHRDLAVTCCEE